MTTIQVKKLLQKNPYQIYQNKIFDTYTSLYIFNYLERYCWTKTHFFKKELLIKKNLNPIWLDFLKNFPTR